MRSPVSQEDLAAGARGRKRRDPLPSARGARRILGLRVDGATYAECTEVVLERAETGAGGMVCVATVHTVMEAFDDPDFQRLVNAADMVTPDGVPLVWALRALGIRRAKRVYGPSLMPKICRHAEERAVPIGLYGGSPRVLSALHATLTESESHTNTLAAV